MCYIAVEPYFRPENIVAVGPCSVELFVVAEPCSVDSFADAGPYSVESFADAVPYSVEFAGPLPVESCCSAYNSAEPCFPADEKKS